MSDSLSSCSRRSPCLTDHSPWSSMNRGVFSWPNRRFSLQGSLTSAGPSSSRTQMAMDDPTAPSRPARCCPPGFKADWRCVTAPPMRRGARSSPAGASVIECCLDGPKAIWSKILHTNSASPVPVCIKVGISACIRWGCGRTSNKWKRKHRISSLIGFH